MAPNILDFIIIACYFLSSLRGGVKQTFSFLAVIISFALAGMFYGSIATVIPDKVFPESFAGAMGFTTVFLLTFGLISLAGRTLDDVFKRLHLGGIDRISSIILGILKGFTLSCMTVVMIMINYPADSSILTDSVGTPYIMPAAKVIVKLLPKEEQKTFSSNAEELMEIWGSIEEE